MLRQSVLDVEDFGGRVAIEEMLALSKAERPEPVLKGLSVCALFEHPSNRTRNSTEVAVYHLGGMALSLFDKEVGIDVRESAEDVARTLACYHQLIAARVREHSVLERMSPAALSMGVPIVNLLSNKAHPVQALADLLTIEEAFGTVAGVRVTYLGDSNNVARSLAKAVGTLGGVMTISSPPDFTFSKAERDEIEHVGGAVNFQEDPKKAVEGCNVLYGDVWASMGQESEAARRLAIFASYQMNEALVDLADKDVKVMHCLPAHRNEEITEGVLEGPQSLVWKQAKNRMRSMRGLLSYWASQE